MSCRVREGTLSVILDDPGRTKDRKERLRGQMGVRSSEETAGWTIGPPDERE
jgi:hypothetical protein